MSFWHRERSSDPESLPILPPTALAILKALKSESLVLTPGEVPIYQSPGISNFGILRDSKVTSEELLSLVRVVRRTQISKEASLEIARGPIGEGKRKLGVVVAPISKEGLILVLMVDESENERIDSMRRDFLTNISHELKTPIGALMLMSEVIASSKDDPEEVATFARKIQQEARRLGHLVQEVINLSKLQAVDPLKVADEVDLQSVVREAVIQCSNSAEARHIKIEVTNVSPAVVLGDMEQLTMAVHNLLDNAINYSAANTSVKVVVRREKEIAEVSVTDQGIGIPEQELERIFERFYRVDPARSRETGGTGLGLSIVKHVVSNHGGEVTVWSAVGIGSTFAIRLPISHNTNALDGVEAA